MVDSLPLPPHSIDAEQSVLGGLMLEGGESWDAVADILTDDDFYRSDHRLIFRACATLVENGKQIDLVTLVDELQKNGLLEKVGNPAYLATLARDTPSTANIRSYAGIVREKSLLRRLIQVGKEVTSSAYNSDGRDARELVEEAERRVFEIAEANSKGNGGLVKVGSVLKTVVDRISHLSRHPDELRGVPTGYKVLDDMTNGLQRGDLIIVAGRPSMGKTTLAVNIAEHAALEQGIPVAIFSMEMADEQVVLRMISSQGRIEQGSLRRGQLADGDWARMNTAVKLLTSAPVYIDDTAALTPTELRARARRMKRENKLGLIVVDYLQLMTVPGTKENRATEISEISRSLKAMARELDVPVIALSQLNRSVEQRTEKKPVMSDLRESGSIEQDADLILLIYREDVYDSATPRKGIADIIIAKQRNGPTGEVQLTFLGQYTKFENYAPEAYGEGVRG